MRGSFAGSPADLVQLRHSLMACCLVGHAILGCGLPPMSSLLDPLPGGLGLRLDDLILTSTTAVALVVATAATAPCPRCGTPSDRVHSRYRRTVADLPCHDRPVALRLVVRRFRCIEPGCPQVIFCERLPGLLDAHARCTARLTDAHRAIGFALGGEAGSRLAAHLDLPTSPDTLLRRVKDAPDEPAPPPRYVGVDDWALRKGQRYGTILIDLERGRVIDILEGRDGAALQAWLKEHPGVEVLTRDRWAAYAQAATEGAPQARQVADRWHLLKNLREAVERLLERHSAPIREALRPAPEAAVPTGAPAEGRTESAPAPPPVEPPPPPDGRVTPQKQARQARRQERVRQYERVKELRAQGQSLRQIARATGLSAKSVVRYLRSGRCPDWKPGREVPTQLGPFAAHVAGWVERGGRNAAELYRELVGLGFRGSYDAVRRYLARRLGSTGRPGPRVGPLSPPAAPAPPTARKLSFEFIRRPEDRTAEEQARLEKLRGCEPALREGLDLAGEFAGMVRQRCAVPLAEWLAKAEASACAELRGFAGGLRSDEAAVGAALSEPWSNGPVEGQVNRLKVIKRQMYGRAGLCLLRARVRYAG
jgi:transposase